MIKRLVLWTLTLATSSLLLSGCLFDFSPDGSQIVYFDLGEGAAGMSPFKKQDGPQYATPSPSQTPRADLRLDKVGGNAPTFLRGIERGIAHQPCWSPDGKKIAFSQTFLNEGGVYLFDVATRQTEKIFDASTVTLLDWKPDGRRLLFAHLVGKGEKQAQLEWFDLATRKLVASLPFDATQTNLRAINQRPIWHPNSDNVFLFGPVAGGSKTFLALPVKRKLLQSSTKNLLGATTTNNGRTLRGLATTSAKSPWQLQFVSAPLGGLPRWRVQSRLDLSKITAPRKPITVECAVFSPNGRHIALVLRFNKNASSAKRGGPQQFALYLMDANGTNAKLLKRTQFFDKELVNNFPVAWFVVRWSRDSRTLGVHYRDGKTGGLFVYDAQGHLKKQLPAPNLVPA